MNGAIVLWWQRLAPRERGLVALGVAVVVAALVYLLLYEPPEQGIRKLRADLPVLRAQDAEMRTMADEAARLRATAGEVTVIAPGARLQAVRRSLERAGLWRDGAGAAAGAAGPVPTLSVAGTVTVTAQQSTRIAPPELTAEAGDRVRVRFDDIDYGVWIAWLAAAEGELSARATRVSVANLAPKAPVGHVRTEVLLDWSKPAAGATS